MRIVHVEQHRKIDHGDQEGRATGADCSHIQSVFPGHAVVVCVRNPRHLRLQCIKLSGLIGLDFAKRSNRKR